MPDNYRRARIVALTAICLAAASVSTAFADPGKLTVQVSRHGHEISPMLYGLMTEEINHSYDGGLYGELIRNRTFKDSSTAPLHWSLVQTGSASGSISLDTADPVNPVLSTSLKLTVAASSAGGRVGVTNEGYWGIPVRPGTRYHASYYARSDTKGGVTVAIESTDGSITLATADVPVSGTVWRHYSCTLETRVGFAASSANRFVIYAAHPGTIWLSQVSLFPPTYDNRKNGNRIDLMQKLAAMKPAFLRLPGGNYLEGDTFDERFAWKSTIHDISERPGHRSPWGYRSTDGMGMLEFLDWCEDLKMQPILAVFAGYVLRGQHVDPGTALRPYVDEALDELEYATGDANTKWGAARVKDGHPNPFKIEYVEIGNEDWFDRSGSYDGRFAQFFDAIRARYPGLKIIATAPVRSRTPDVIDDHYYRSAADMERDVHHYDNYSRSGPKIFVGEWASTEGSPTPTLQAALGDGAWMTGMERNSDLIPISCYAPLFVNVNPGARQWGTNLIGYDALNSFGSPSYYVQEMFANNRGDIVLPYEITPQPAAATVAEPGLRGGIGVGTWQTQAEFKDIKVTGAAGDLLTWNPQDKLNGWKPSQGSWTANNDAIAQSQERIDCRLTAGESAWTDYHYSLKARKIAGAEGFLILFHVKDNDNYLWWNIGGWGNTRSAIERAEYGAKQTIGQPAPVSIETGRWYDIMIDIHGTRIGCYLDGKLITEADDVPGKGVDPLYAAASKDIKTGEIILKVVNVSAGPQQLVVDLQGSGRVSGGILEQISGEPGDVNTIQQPEKVAPHKEDLKVNSARFEHTFPAYSVTVMRLRAAPARGPR